MKQISNIKSVLFIIQFGNTKPYEVCVIVLLKKPPVESGGLILEKVESTPPNPENKY